jgi:hypothetical protein
MKKQVKRLMLAKETLKNLELSKLQEVLGGLAEQPPTHNPACP